jgi:hypothetical protein
MRDGVRSACEPWSASATPRPPRKRVRAAIRSATSRRTRTETWNDVDLDGVWYAMLAITT